MYWQVWAEQYMFVVVANCRFLIFDTPSAPCSFDPWKGGRFAVLQQDLKPIEEGFHHLEIGIWPF